MSERSELHSTHLVVGFGQTLVTIPLNYHCTFNLKQCHCCSDCWTYYTKSWRLLCARSCRFCFKRFYHCLYEIIFTKIGFITENGGRMITLINCKCVKVSNMLWRSLTFIVASTILSWIEQCHMILRLVWKVMDLKHVSVARKTWVRFVWRAISAKNVIMPPW